jgi:predicted amidohydrolase YtcJ
MCPNVGTVPGRRDVGSARRALPPDPGRGRLHQPHLGHDVRRPVARPDRPPRPSPPMRPTRLLAPALAGLVAAACAAEPETPADLIVVNATIYTADSARWTAEAMAVKDGKVLYVGSRDSAMAFKGRATQVDDLAGATVFPGLTDAHAHVVGLGELLRDVDLVDTESYDEVIARVVERAKTTPKGQWILGRGWDQNDWEGDKAFPTHDKLSAAVPDHPVYLTRVDGHAGLANAAAMALAKVTAFTPEPPGGAIMGDARGEPSGVFVDNAESLITAVIPPMDSAQLREAVVAAQREMHRWGLTGVHDAGATAATLAAYEGLGADSTLTIRLYAMLADNGTLLNDWFARGPQSGLYGDRLWVRSIKAYMDGALGSRGAALLEPYHDAPHTKGLLVSTPEHIRALGDSATKYGFQLNVHAIGDRGNRLVLDAMEAALAATPGEDRRWRIEHAQIIETSDLPRFARAGIIPSMQASHQTSDMYWVQDRLGPDRLLGAYAWRSLLNTGVIIPNGTDFPVEKVNPFITFHASIARQDDKNWPEGGWRPDERMTRDEALLSMTLWAARAAFQEQILGSLTPGKYADFTVLDQDLMTVPAEQVLATQVLRTVVGGRTVYAR